MMGKGMGGMDDMMNSMMEIGGGRPGGKAGGNPGNFVSQSFFMSSDSSGGGPPKVQQFSQSSVGAMHNGEMVSETQQSYSDSRSGMQKAALERAKGQRARKIIKERTHGGKETSRDILKNVREDETGAFDNEWHTAASASQLSNSKMRALGPGGPFGGKQKGHAQLENTAYGNRDTYRGSGNSSRRQQHEQPSHRSSRGGASSRGSTPPALMSAEAYGRRPSVSSNSSNRSRNSSRSSLYGSSVRSGYR